MHKTIYTMFSLLLFSGCVSNPYLKSYVDSPDHPLTNHYPREKQKEIAIRMTTSESGVIDTIEDGYVMCGRSKFTDVHRPYYLAIDCAKEIDCDLVLLDEKFKDIEEYTSVIYLPSYSTTHTSGSIDACASGTYGSSYVSGNVTGCYSGTSTTTTMTPVTRKEQRVIFFQNAAYFKKLNLSGYYGTVFFVPPKLPTQKKNDPCTVKIFAVIKGSQAEKDGIKRGDIVKSINGKSIVTRADMSPFTRDLASVKSVEVEK